MAGSGVSTTTQPASPATEQFALRQRSPVQRVQHLLHTYPAISPFLVLVISFVVFSTINPRVASPNSLSLVLQQVAVIGALAVGVVVWRRRR